MINRLLYYFYNLFKSNKSNKPNKQKKRNKIVKSQYHSYYNIDTIFKSVLNTYFEIDPNEIKIRWFGSPFRVNRRSITLGTYSNAKKLVSINRKLDNKIVPLFVVEFIVYHELLHHKYPPIYDNHIHKHIIHGSQFKNEEKQFENYIRSKNWINENKLELMKGV